MAIRRTRRDVLLPRKSDEYYQQKRAEFDIAALNEGNYAANSKGIQKMVKKRWEM
jgi:hypothetical protein